MQSLMRSARQGVVYMGTRSAQIDSGHRVPQLCKPPSLPPTDWWDGSCLDTGCQNSDKLDGCSRESVAEQGCRLARR
jgi:hypothetical protein